MPNWCYFSLCSLQETSCPCTLYPLKCSKNTILHRYDHLLSFGLASLGLFVRLTMNWAHFCLVYWQFQPHAPDHRRIFSSSWRLFLKAIYRPFMPTLLSSSFTIMNSVVLFTCVAFSRRSFHTSTTTATVATSRHIRKQRRHHRTRTATIKPLSTCLCSMSSNGACAGPTKRWCP